MNIALTKPIIATATVDQQTQQTDITVEWILITPDKHEMRLKVQPLNIEVAIIGAQYDAISAQLSAALSALIAPSVQASLPENVFVPTPDPEQ